MMNQIFAIYPRMKRIQKRTVSLWHGGYYARVIDGKEGESLGGHGFIFSYRAENFINGSHRWICLSIAQIKNKISIV